MKTATVAAMVAFCLATLFAEEHLRSPLESAVGQPAGPFQVKDCTGPAAGKTVCYYCRYGHRPVVGVFVRTLNEDVARLIERLDRAVEEHRDERLAAFVVLIAADTPEAEQELKQLAEKSRVRHLPLTIFRDQPETLRDVYKISDTTPTTVMMWKEGKFTLQQAMAKVDAPQIAGWVAEMKKSLAR